MEKSTKPSLFQLSACTYLSRKRMRESMDRGSNWNGEGLSSPHWSLARRVPCRSQSTMFPRTDVRWGRTFPKRDAITSQDRRTSVGGTFSRGSCGFTGPRSFTIGKFPPSIRWAILCHWRRLVRVGPSPSLHCTSTWASSHNPSIEIRLSPLAKGPSKDRTDCCPYTVFGGPRCSAEMPPVDPSRSLRRRSRRRCVVCTQARRQFGAMATLRATRTVSGAARSSFCRGRGAPGDTSGPSTTGGKEEAREIAVDRWRTRLRTCTDRARAFRRDVEQPTWMLHALPKARMRCSATSEVSRVDRKY